MKKSIFSKVVVSAAMLASTSVFAGNLPAIDSVVTTTFDKSIIHGSLAHDTDGHLLYDGAGNARFQYTGKIYAIATDNKTGELTTLANQIGDITGEAAFPKMFVAMSTQVNGLMNSMLNGTFDGNMPQFPAIVPWTCNHCDMTVAGKHYVSIVDVLDPNNPYGLDANVVSAIQTAFNNNVAEGAEGSIAKMRMDGRAFTGLGPASFDPATRTMGVRMAGCSALVNLTDMKIGTLCMNATAVFDVGETATDASNPYGYAETSKISAEGSSNCVTVMQPMK